MFFDYDAERAQKGRAVSERQTRCYLITGATETLDELEALLHCVERMRATEGNVQVCALASWAEDEEANG